MCEMILLLGNVDGLVTVHGKGTCIPSHLHFSDEGLIFTDGSGKKYATYLISSHVTTSAANETDVFLSRNLLAK